MSISMMRSIPMAKLVRQITQLRVIRIQTPSCSYSTMVQSQGPKESNVNTMSSLESLHKHQVGENVSRKDKISFLVNTLLDLKDSKEAVYGALDAWVAWERNFPIGPLKRALLTLEKEQQWHRVVQVIKWMLSKGQGKTMGTYGQLIRALDMDHRAKEAHEIWVKKIGSDLHSVSWQLCNLMISVYYRNNMLDNLVKLFKGLEAFDRTPPEKSLVRKVADAYEILGLHEEKERVLEKYKDLLSKTEKGGSKTSRWTSSAKKREKSGQKKHGSNSGGLRHAVDGAQTS